MNSIRSEPVAIDTNVYLFALRRDSDHPACEGLVFDKLSELQVHIPLQVLFELYSNLDGDEMRGLRCALARAKTVTSDYASAAPELITHWKQRGAKKGDAVIAAHLESAAVRRFVSENRHFLAELSPLPFEVLSSGDVMRLLGSS